MTPYVVCCIVVAGNLGIAVICYVLGRKEGVKAGDASGYAEGYMAGLRDGKMQPRAFEEAMSEDTAVADISDYAKLSRTPTEAGA